MSTIKEQIKIQGVLTLETGLHIGGTKDDIGISTSDNPIAVNALDGTPYIPGSSLKGKMRSLYELSGHAKGPLYTDKKNKKGEVIGREYHPCKCGKKDCIVCTLFGAHQNMKGESGVPRVIFRDAQLSERFRSIDIDKIIEIKSETAIDRNAGTAKDGSLRQVERISAGATFDYEIIINIWDGDNAEVLQAAVESGLRMIEATGLGAKNSNGYGKVNFGIGTDSYKVTRSKFGE